MNHSWQEIWSNRGVRRPLEAHESLDAFLLQADGYDTPFGRVHPEPWLRWVVQALERFGIKKDHSIFEIGCGAGAFLIEPWRRGHQVGGIDLSPELVSIADSVMPGGDFNVADALQHRARGRWDLVVACGVMMYFSAISEAESVMQTMASTARHSVGLFDLPDLARQSEAENFRRGRLDPDEYKRRYSGLDHLYFDRDHVCHFLIDLGFSSVTVEDQSIEGYANGKFRFNVFAVR